MGYRSVVAYKMWFEDVATRDAYIDMILARNEPLLETALSECNIAASQPYIAFEAESVKWYHGFDDVEAHNTLLGLAAEWFPDKYGAYFRRMGEDLNDLEDEYYGSDKFIDESDIEVHRSLSLYTPSLSISLDEFKARV